MSKNSSECSDAFRVLKLGKYSGNSTHQNFRPALTHTTHDYYRRNINRKHDTITKPFHTYTMNVASTRNSNEIRFNSHVFVVQPHDTLLHFSLNLYILTLLRECFYTPSPSLMMTFSPTFNEFPTD